MIQLKPNARILITRTDRIGDLVLSTPVFSAIKEKYPASFLCVLTFIENQEIIKGHGCVDEVILYDKKGGQKNFLGNLKLSKSIAKKKFDIVIHLHATNRMHLLTWMARVPIRLGWDRRMPWALTHVLSYEKKNGQKHEAFYNFVPLELLGIPTPKKLKTFFSVTKRNQSSVEELLANRRLGEKKKPWVVINPWASGPEKMWSKENFAEVINQIKKKYDAEVFLIGTLADRIRLEEMKEFIVVDFEDLTGQLSLGMLGAFLAKCDLLISNDSGPVHVAQAVGLYVISIFVREDPGLSSRRWGPVGENSITLDNLPVSVENALSAIQQSGRLEEFVLR